MRLNLFRPAQNYAIWLDRDDKPGMGIVLGTGGSVAEARHNAAQVLHAALDRLPALEPTSVHPLASVTLNLD